SRGPPRGHDRPELGGHTTEDSEMDDKELRGLLDAIKAGRVSRRSFVETMLALGLTTPVVGQMFAAAGIAHAQPKTGFLPTKRGGGGALQGLWGASPTLLKPHLPRRPQDHD